MKKDPDQSASNADDGGDFEGRPIDPAEKKIDRIRSINHIGEMENANQGDP